MFSVFWLVRDFVYFGQFRKHIVITYVLYVIFCSMDVITIITTLVNDDNKNKSHTRLVKKFNEY